MPLASPSPLTSNTLATFLDHVPISTNNAEKWKPKQMGFNTGRDYWALSRALSAPLGTERWILHHIFLSAGTKAGGQTTASNMFTCHRNVQAWLTRSFLSSAQGMNVRDCSQTNPFIEAFLKFFIHCNIFYVITNELGCKSPHCIIWRTLAKEFPPVPDHVGPAACKQCLILWQQFFVLLTDTTK